MDCLYTRVVRPGIKNEVVFIKICVVFEIFTDRPSWHQNEKLRQPEKVARDVLSIKRRKSTTLKENSDVGEDSNSEVEGTEEKV